MRCIVESGVRCWLYDDHAQGTKTRQVEFEVYGKTRTVTQRITTRTTTVASATATTAAATAATVCSNSSGTTSTTAGSKKKRTEVVPLCLLCFKPTPCRTR